MTAYLDGYSGYSGVSEDAAAEILEKLMTHQQISSDEVAQILKRYGVCGEPEALQIAYRKKVGQRLIASLRDPYGRREVFSTGSTYVLVDCCNDRDALDGDDGITAQLLHCFKSYLYRIAPTSTLYTIYLYISSKINKKCR